MEKRIAFSLNENDYQKLKLAAKEDKRTVGKYVQAVIESVLKKHQFSTKEAPK